MSSGEDFRSVANVVLAESASDDKSLDSVRVTQFRQSEKILVNYFLNPQDREELSYEMFERVGDVTPAGYNGDDADEYMLMEQGESGAFDHHLQDWLKECAHAKPEDAFKSMYRVLTAVEKAEDGEGMLDIDTHSALLKGAVRLVEKSAMDEHQKFIAYAGLLKFVGAAEQREMDKVLTPAMQGQLSKMDDQCLCGLVFEAYMAGQWDVDPTQQDHGAPEQEFVIDGVHVSTVKEPDFVDDFVNNGVGLDYDRARSILAGEIQKRPERLLPLLEEHGHANVRSLLLTMELVNDMPDGAADRLPILLEAKKVELLENANNIRTPEL